MKVLGRKGNVNKNTATRKSVLFKSEYRNKIRKESPLKTQKESERKQERK